MQGNMREKLQKYISIRKDKSYKQAKATGVDDNQFDDEKMEDD